MTIQPPVDIQKLFLNVMGRKKYDIPPHWIGANFTPIYLAENTATGDMGEEFVEKFCKSLGFNVVPNKKRKGKKARLQHDTTINSNLIEIKTATLGVSKAFQFCNVRKKYKYDFLFCLGVLPNDIMFNVYRHADVKSMKEGPYILAGCEDSVLPGHMTPNQKNAPTEDNFKLNKPPKELRHIAELQAVLTALFNEQATN